MIPESMPAGRMLATCNDRRLNAPWLCWRLPGFAVWRKYHRVWKSLFFECREMQNANDMLS